MNYQGNDINNITTIDLPYTIIPLANGSWLCAYWKDILGTVEIIGIFPNYPQCISEIEKLKKIDPVSFTLSVKYNNTVLNLHSPAETRQYTANGVKERIKELMYKSRRVNILRY